MTLRCRLDGFLLHAEFRCGERLLSAYDGTERFVLDALEAMYYDVVDATIEELLRLERAHYRLLRRRLSDFAPRDASSPSGQCASHSCQCLSCSV